MTEIHVVTLLEFGPAEAHAFRHKSGIGEMTNGSKLFFPPWRNSPWCARVSSLSRIYRGVQLSPYPDPGWKHVTATNTYNTITRLTAYSTNSVNMFLLFVRRKYWYSVVSLDRCSLFPSRVGLRTYQHPGMSIVFCGAPV